MREATVTSMEAIEAAARHAALTRGEGPSSTDYGAEPSILHAPSEQAGVEAILRHRLRLPGDVRLSTYEDLNHPSSPARSTSARPAPSCHRGAAPTSSSARTRAPGAWRSA